MEEQLIVGLDADCFKCLMDAIIGEVDCPSVGCLEIIVQRNGHIPVDSTDYLLHQWNETTGVPSNIFVKDWISDRIIDGTIKKYESTGRPEVRRDLRIQGVPNKDRKNVSIMVDIGAEYFLSNDIDLFDPSRKGNCSAANFQKLVVERKGRICKRCEKRYNIKICHMASFVEIEAMAVRDEEE